MAILQKASCWYTFEDFTDSHHYGYDLTANGDATASDGVASFDGTGDYAQISTPIGHDFQIGDQDFAGSVWVNWDSAKAGSETVFVSVGNSWRVRKSTAERLQFFCTKATSGNDQAQLTGPYSDSTWYHIFWWFNSSTQTIGIRVNDTDEDTTALSDDVQEIVNNLTIGGAFGSLSHQGDMKHLVMWKGYIPSSSEITALYNSGTPLGYWDVDFNNEVQYNLDDANDTRGHRYDVLTATGSVTHTTGKVGDCADFSGTAQRYTSTDHIYKYIGDEDFNVSFWVNPDTLANAGLFGQDNNSWSIQLLSSGKIRFRLNTSDGAKTNDSTTTISTSTWSLIECYHDKTNDVIGISIDNATAKEESTNGGTPVKRGLDCTLASIGSNNHFDGQIDDVTFRRGSLFTTTERSDKYNSGSGAVAKNEIELDYNVTGSGAKYLRVQAKAAELPGSGTAETAWPWVITDAQLASGLHDSDDSTNVAAAGGPSLRISKNSDGSGQVARRVLELAPASSGGDVTIKIHPEEANHSAGQDFYLWWIPGGGEKPEPLASSRYGSEFSFDTTFAANFDKAGYVDSTGNDNDGTATNVTESTDVPYGSMQSWDFASSDSRVVVPDDNSLDLTDKICVMMWFKYDGNNSGSTSQGLMNKRVGSTANWNLSFDPDANMNWGFYSGGWQEVSPDFSTSFPSTDTWYRVVATLEDTGADVDIELFKNTTSIASTTATSVVIPANSETVKLGNIENVSGVFNTFVLDGHIHDPWLLNDIPSDNALGALDNNQTDPETFWDHTYTIQSVDSSGSVSGSVTQGGQTFSGTVEVEVSASGTLTQGGQTLSGTATVDLSVSGTLTQGGQTLSGTVTTDSEVNLSGSLTQGGQALSGTSTIELSVSGALTQGGQTITGTSTVELSVSGALTQGGQSLNGTVVDTIVQAYATGDTSVFSRATGTVSINP